MKRKRFIKLAMSYGVQRNRAEKIARLISICGSYENLYEAEIFALEMNRAEIFFRRLGNAIVQVWETIEENMVAALKSINWTEVLENQCEMEGGQ